MSAKPDENKPNAESLEAKWKNIEDELPDTLNLRMRRALSWLARAEQEMDRDDPDAAFIFYWISFNAAYADADKHREMEEWRAYREYLDTIATLDNSGDRQVQTAVARELRDTIDNLLENVFAFRFFWDLFSGRTKEGTVIRQFKQRRREATRAQSRGFTDSVLIEAFERLYVLRNQLLHGGATWRGSLNRQQVEDGASIMSTLMPIMIDLMLDNPKFDWGQPAYPPADPIY